MTPAERVLLASPQARLAGIECVDSLNFSYGCLKCNHIWMPIILDGRLAPGWWKCPRCHRLGEIMCPNTVTLLYGYPGASWTTLRGYSPGTSV
jgi:hypothetical protein